MNINIIFARHTNYRLFSEHCQYNFVIFSEFRNKLPNNGGVRVYQKIKEFCKQSKVSVNKLEKDLGFAKGYVCKLDVSSPSVENAKKIADYLNIDINALL